MNTDAVRVHRSGVLSRPVRALSHRPPSTSISRAHLTSKPALLRQALRHAPRTFVALSGLSYPSAPLSSRRYYSESSSSFPASSSLPSSASHTPPSNVKIATPAKELSLQRLKSVISTLDVFQRSVVDSSEQQLIVLGVAGTGTFHT